MRFHEGRCLLVRRPIVRVEPIDHILGGCDKYDVAQLAVHRNRANV